MSALAHRHKWTNQLVEQCSTFTSTFPSFNKYQTSQRLLPSSSCQAMPQDYRAYASSLSKQNSHRKIETSANMYDYLKTLSFIKCRHTEDCTQEGKLKRKATGLKSRKESERVQAAAVLTKHIHTVQTVLVPPPQQIIYQPIIKPLEMPFQHAQTPSRPVSAPKININYVSPTGVGSSNLHQFFRPSDFRSRWTRVESSHKQKGIEVVQISKQAENSRIRIISGEKSCVIRQPEAPFIGDASKNSQTLSNSFKIEPANMKASDVLVYTFKQIEEGLQQS